MSERRVPIPEVAVAYLTDADPIMASLIERVGPIDYSVDRNLWRAMVGSIVGQQLSVKAAATIRARVAALGSEGFPDPVALLAVPEDRLRECGLSRSKASYVRDAARYWVAGRIDEGAIAQASDEAVIEELVSLRGVGRWTAEMVLIFSLGRRDVLAVDDLGIRVAVQKAYGLDDRPDRATVHAVGEAWKPYRTFASLYLWRSLQA